MRGVKKVTPQTGHLIGCESLIYAKPKTPIQVEFKCSHNVAGGIRPDVGSGTAIPACCGCGRTVNRPQPDRSSLDHALELAWCPCRIMRRRRHIAVDSDQLGCCKTYGILENLPAKPHFRKHAVDLLPDPVRVVERRQIGLRMRHHSEHPPAHVANRSDAVD